MSDNTPNTSVAALLNGVDGATAGERFASLSRYLCRKAGRFHNLPVRRRYLQAGHRLTAAESVDMDSKIGGMAAAAGGKAEDIEGAFAKAEEFESRPGEAWTYLDDALDSFVVELLNKLGRKTIGTREDRAGFRVAVSTDPDYADAFTAFLRRWGNEADPAEEKGTKAAPAARAGVNLKAALAGLSEAAE